MKGNYNPFSKTYQILCFQEQIAHKKNLQSVKSINKSNIKVVQRPQIKKKKKYNRSQSQYNLVQSQILQPHVLIHKNRPFENRQNEKRINENRRMAAKLMNISCSVITRDESLKQYENYKMYKDISSRYNKNGMKKNFLNLDLSSSFFSSTDNCRAKSRKGVGSTVNVSTCDDKAFSFYDDQMKPRYK